MRVVASPSPLAYTVRRSTRARRARLTVTDEGEVVVVLPQRAASGEAARLVSRHAAWLDRHVGRVRAEQARLLDRQPLGDGRLVSVEGQPIPVEVLDPTWVGGRRARVELIGGQLLVAPTAADPDVVGALERWLRELARVRLLERITTRASELGVRPGRISVRDQRTRWASASSGGGLSFSWRLILAPPFVLDAVVVHELAHLRIRGHSPTFWALVERHAPRTREARRWLREHAREVRAALD
jgi:predicted metal-dependent hydrolase